MTVMDRWTVDELLATVNRATPYETLSREVLEGVLGMLAGAYPSDEFAELKPRVTWDRTTDVIAGRRDARVVAVTSGGTIPDRGLFGVFMVGEAGHARPAGRRARRGDGLREPDRRGHHPRREQLADRGDLATTGSPSRRRRACRASCRSGTATRSAGRSSSAGRSGRSSARPRRTSDAGARGRAGDDRPPARPPRPRRAGRPRTSSPTSRTSARRPAPCRRTSGSSSSASATSSATGGW